MNQALVVMCFPLTSTQQSAGVHRVVGGGSGEELAAVLEVRGDAEQRELPHFRHLVTVEMVCHTGRFPCTGDVLLEANGLRTLEGFYVDDALQGHGVYMYEDGAVLKGTYIDGELNGPAQEFDAEGHMVFKGQYKDNIRCGECWLYNPDGGYVFGAVNKDGEMSGNSLAYIYPDNVTALYGNYMNAELIQAEVAHVVFDHNQKLHFKTTNNSLKYFSDKSTSSCIASHALLPDPYESDRVFVENSKIKGAGQGLFSKVDVEAETVMAFYNGVRITHSEVDSRDWSLNGNTISLNEDTVIDVPHPFDQLDKYCASLGHKANHSFTPNCKYQPFVHPRFGPIKCIRTLRAVQKEEELTVSYGYNDEAKESNGPEAPEWYKLELQEFQKNQ